MTVPFLRTPYNYDTNAAGDESGLACLEPTMAKQEFREECDINTIAERFGLYGELPESFTMPLEGDFTEITDYQSALNKIMAANDAFMLMPAQVRERFQNDAHQFVDFCSDPANLDEARKLGLARPVLEPPAPLRVEVVPQVPPPPPAP